MNEQMTATHGLAQVRGTGPVSITFTGESSGTWSLEEVAAVLAANATDTGLVVSEVHVPAQDWVEFATLSCPEDLVAVVGPATYDAAAVLWVCATTLVNALRRYVDLLE